MKIYVVADLHFNDKQIIDFERKQFATIDEHNEYIIQKFNEVVTNDDLTYFLGDLGFGNWKEIRKLVKRLNGRKVLIFGNHDIFSDDAAKEMGFEQIYHHPIYVSSGVILSHEPVLEAYKNSYVINVHGHLHNSELNEKNFFNVNLARRQYRPQRLDYFLSYAANHCKSRRETFGNEWYMEDYKFDPGTSKEKKR